MVPGDSTHRQPLRHIRTFSHPSPMRLAPCRAIPSAPRLPIVPSKSRSVLGRSRPSDSLSPDPPFNATSTLCWVASSENARPMSSSNLQMASSSGVGSIFIWRFDHGVDCSVDGVSRVVAGWPPFCRRFFAGGFASCWSIRGLSVLTSRLAGPFPSRGRHVNGRCRCSCSRLRVAGARRAVPDVRLPTCAPHGRVSRL